MCYCFNLRCREYHQGDAKRLQLSVLPSRHTREFGVFSSGQNCWTSQLDITLCGRLKMKWWNNQQRLCVVAHWLSSQFYQPGFLPFLVKHQWKKYTTRTQTRTLCSEAQRTIHHFAIELSKSLTQVLSFLGAVASVHSTKLQFDRGRLTMMLSVFLAGLIFNLGSLILGFVPNQIHQFVIENKQLFRLVDWSDEVSRDGKTVYD